MTNPIDNTQDLIDSRDIIERIEDLEAALQEAYEATKEKGETNLDFDEWREAVISDQSAAHENEFWDDAKELRALQALAKECDHVSDWAYGETLIREDYFTKYIENLIDDCYEMPKEMNSGNWPYRHMTIDYEAAAEEAKIDYEEVDFDGVTYFIRSV